MDTTVIHAARKLILSALVIATVAANPTIDALARPVVFEEVAQIEFPDSPYFLSDVIALDGNDLLACGIALIDDDRRVGLFHFERDSEGTWAYRGMILDGGISDYYYYCRLAFEDGVAVFLIGTGSPYVLEKTTSGWVINQPVPRTVADVATRNGTVALGVGYRGRSYVHLLRKDTTGQWITTNVLQGAPGYPDDDFLGPEIELSSDTVLAANYSMEADAELTYVFDKVDGNWQRTDILEGMFATQIRDDDIAIRRDDDVDGVIAAYARRNIADVWQNYHWFESVEWLGDKRTPGVTLEGEGEAAVAYAPSPRDDLRGTDAGSITVLRQTPNYPPNFEHVATLVGSDIKADTRLGSGFSADGRRVAAKGANTGISGKPKIYIFELPATLPAPALFQDTFEDLNAAGWTPWGHTNWRVVASAGSNVFRQSNLQGDARATFDEFESDNQSIQADVRINAVGDPTRHCWAGLMARYTDPANFYYLMNGKSTLQIRKMVNGTFGPIATVPFTMQVGRSYRLRLEVIGTRLRAYVDDKLLMDVRDSSLSHGRPGFTMWKTDTQYDNVLISSNPLTTLFADTFSGNEDENAATPWGTEPEGAWNRTPVSGNTVYRQSVAEGDARANTGEYTDDMILTAEIRPRSFHPKGGFAGLMARFQNGGTYYYVLLTKSGKASLRRFSSGLVHVLDESPFPVTLNTSYRVRFEVIGTHLRLYVNDRLMAEADDNVIDGGYYGLVTYRTAADYDNFRVSRP